MGYRFRLAAIALLFGVSQASAFDQRAADAWIEEVISTWDGRGRSYAHFMQDYEPFNDYLNYGTSQQCKDVAGQGKVLFDDRGVALQLNRVTKEYAFAPVMAAQCGLKAYGAGDYATMWPQVEALLASQTDKGGFADEGPYFYYLAPNQMKEAGGLSGMSQGQALSLLARAYRLKPDPRLIESGDRAVESMGTLIKEGGVMADLSAVDEKFANLIMFEEAPVTPASHILNGHIFALLGLYDWSQVPDAKNREMAKELFERGTESVKAVLPYYDLGRITSYDLAHITHHMPEPRLSVSYHLTHIYLVHAMYSITGDEVFRQYRDKWQGYADAFMPESKGQ